MTRPSPVDLSTFKGAITRLLPGKALGADDLTAWAQRRAMGRAGVPRDDEREKKRLKKMRETKRAAQRKRRKQHAREIEHQERMRDLRCAIERVERGADPEHPRMRRKRKRGDNSSAPITTPHRVGPGPQAGDESCPF
jgi:hypothetical protein